MNKAHVKIMPPPPGFGRTLWPAFLAFLAFLTIGAIASPYGRASGGEPEPAVPDSGRTGFVAGASINELRDFQKYTYEPGGADPMLAPDLGNAARPNSKTTAGTMAETTERADTERADEAAMRDDGQRNNAPELPDHDESPESDTIPADFHQLDLKIERVFPEQGKGRAMIDGKMRAVGDTLLQEGGQPVLRIESIDGHGVVFEFRGGLFYRPAL